MRQTAPLAAIAAGLAIGLLGCPPPPGEPPPVCGNAKLEGAEKCDDGNTADGDTCSSDCKVFTPIACGNGKVEGSEQCDDGNKTPADGGAGATQITCPQAVVSPGLINAHDHTGERVLFPYVADAGSDERYEHRNDWRVGGPNHDNHTPIPSPGFRSVTQIRWLELRQ